MRYRETLASNRKPKSEDDSYVRLDKSLGTIYLMGDITQKIASDFRQFIRTVERLKKLNQVTVELNSFGGDIEAGFMIIDSIDLCTKPVTTRVTGVAMSMASLILAAGTNRESMPNSSIMIHQGTYRLYTPFDEIDTEASECKRIEKLCNDFLDIRTGQESGYWEKRHGGKNLYLTPEQALTEKIINSIMKKKS